MNEAIQDYTVNDTNSDVNNFVDYLQDNVSFRTSLTGLKDPFNLFDLG